MRSPCLQCGGMGTYPCEIARGHVTCAACSGEGSIFRTVVEPGYTCPFCAERIYKPDATECPTCERSIW